MILISMALLAAPTAVTNAQCRTSEQMLTEAHGYLARVQPMMQNRQRLSDQLARMRAGGSAKPVSLFSSDKSPARLRDTIISLGQQIEFERQTSAARIAALRLAC